MPAAWAVQHRLDRGEDLALSTGALLGPYEVLAPLGAGGMGEVYRAKDTRLGREVAVKVLPDEVASDSGALTRFEREARAVAALSHPNILALHDVGESSGVRFLVTELLQGETLRAALRDGALPVKRALEIAEQVARGLAAAHESGIVHRDVKPENVFVTRDGHVKVLDFGLARGGALLADGADTRSPTAPVATSPGAVVGTIAYMSPEQAKGQPAGIASDQFSLGVVLYEMLSGVRPFRGGSGAETLTAIIRDEPEPLTKLAPSVPAPVRWIVERCLSKEPGERYDSTRDLARDLALWRLHGAEAGEAAPGGARGRGALLRAVPVVLALAAGAAGMSLFARRAGGPPGAGASPVIRSSIDIRPAASLTPLGARPFLPRVYRPRFALSPDGREIVFAATRGGPGELFVRNLAQDEAAGIPGSQGEESPSMGSLNWPAPFYSQDGAWIGFWARGAIWRVPGKEGPPVRLLEVKLPPYGVSFAPDGAILLGPCPDGPIQRLPAASGKLEAVTKVDAAAGELGHRFPWPLPGGRALLYTSVDSWLDLSGWKIVAQRLPDGERRVLVTGASDGRYVPTGHLVYARRGALHAVPFDPERLEVTGPEVPVLGDVMHAMFVNQAALNGPAQYSFSASGSLAYLPGGVEPEPRLVPVWMDRDGRTTPIEGLPPGFYRQPKLSLDGTSILIARTEENRGFTHVLDLRRGTLTTPAPPDTCSGACWFPDGRRYACLERDGSKQRLLEVSVPSGDQRSLHEFEGERISLAAFTPDGKSLVIGRSSGAGGTSADSYWLWPVGSDLSQARPLREAKQGSTLVDVVLSPDGRLLAYASNESGIGQVYVQSVENGSDRQQVSELSGDDAFFGPDGRELFFVGRKGSPGLEGPSVPGPGQRALHVVSVTPGSPPVLGKPRVVCDLPEGFVNYTSFSVTPDGKRFALVVQAKLPDPAPTTHIRLVQGWFDELKAKVRPAGR